MTYGQFFNRQTTTQKQPLPLRDDMSQMASGGYGFDTTNWAKLNRFVMIGSEGGTYYETDRALTIETAPAAILCIQENGERVVNELVRISKTGEAPSKSPAIFVLALCYVFGNTRVKAYALSQLSVICEIGTNLFEFMDTLVKLRGTKSMGRGLRRAIAAWYTSRRANNLALQLVKYRDRFGWTHRDVLRLGHVRGKDAWQEKALGWAAGKVEPEDTVIPMSKFLGDSNQQSSLIVAFKYAQEAKTENEWMALIEEYNLPREALPTQALNSALVWEALLHKLPMMGMLRNLNKMTQLGLFAPFSSATNLVVDRLTNADYIQHSRIHPLAVLIAAKVYASGGGLLGKLNWTPNSQIVAALDTAFALSFNNVPATSQNILVGVDVSDSMRHMVSGIAGLSAREAAVATALVYARSNPNTHIIGFSGRTIEIPISLNSSLREVTQWVNDNKIALDTNCALPFIYAREHNLPVDGVLMITDSQSFAGSRHASVEADNLRRAINREVRWVNVQTTVQSQSIQDPNDRLGMEFAGFAPSMMNVANAFFRGEI